MNCPDCANLGRPCVKHIPFKRGASGLLFAHLFWYQNIKDSTACHVVTRAMWHLKNEHRGVPSTMDGVPVTFDCSVSC